MSEMLHCPACALLAAPAAAAGALALGIAAIAGDTVPEVNVKMETPAAVALSKPGEKRWGYHQFPALSRLPDGRIALTYSANEDAVATYGTDCPAFVSADGGRTWTSLEKADFPGLKPHPSICEVAEGEFLCVPPTKPFDLKAAGLEMSEAVAGTEKSREGISLHRFDDCPKGVQAYVREMDAWRWTPAARAWKQDRIEYDTKGLLVWKRARGPEAHLVPRTWFEHSPVKSENELIYADYRTKYEEGKESASPVWSSTCMVSSNKGKTWRRRGTIAAGTAKRPMCEPVMAPASDGRFACSIRTAPGPLVITFSGDRGRTWTPVKPLHEFGVFPGLILLENGIMAVSFGRPGVHMKFSPDGRGERWTGPTTLIPAEGKWNELTCGYTSLLAVGRDEFLVAYSDFKHRDGEGRECKAILVCRVRVTPR